MGQTQDARLLEADLLAVAHRAQTGLALIVRSGSPTANTAPLAGGYGFDLGLRLESRKPGAWFAEWAELLGVLLPEVSVLNEGALHGTTYA